MSTAASQSENLQIWLGQCGRVLAAPPPEKRASRFIEQLRELASMILKGHADKIEAIDAARQVGLAAGLTEGQVQTCLAAAIESPFDAAAYQRAMSERLAVRDRVAVEPGNKSAPAFVPPEIIDTGSWTGPAPQRRWAVHNVIPKRSVTLLSGAGGSGKSYLMLQLAVAHVLGKDWFGFMPERGPVLYVTAEEEGLELRQRLEVIAQHYGSSIAEITAAGLTMVSLATSSPLCFVADRNSVVTATPLFGWIGEQVTRLRPVNIILDPITDMAAVNENSRLEVLQVYGHCRRLAIAGDSGLVMTGHLSKTGDYSGNTAWHNSARSRLMLGIPADAEDVSRVRLLVHEKNQFGPLQADIGLQWEDGLWRQAKSEVPLRGAERGEQVRRLTFNLILEMERRGDAPSHNVNYAAGQLVVAHEASGSKLRISKHQFKVAISELLLAKEVHIGDDRYSNRTIRKALKAGPQRDAQ